MAIRSELQNENQKELLDRFVAHDLAHITTTADGEIHMFEANGAGVGLGDLDRDSDLDVVLGNTDGRNSLLWNEGGLHFRKEELPVGQTRVTWSLSPCARRG